MKLGRKKDLAVSRSQSPHFDGNVRVHDYLSPAHGLAVWAVPVADSRKPVKTDERESYVSDTVANP